MPIKAQLKCFKHLDEGDKGFLTYQDFCNLTEERRMKVDPAQSLIKQITAKTKGQVPSSEAKEKLRLKQLSE